MKPVTKLTLEGTSGELSDQGKKLTKNSPFAPNVDGNPVPTITIENVSRFSDQVPPIEDIVKPSTLVQFGSSGLDAVELHIFNLKTVLLESAYNVAYEPYSQLIKTKYTNGQKGKSLTSVPSTSPVPNISVDLHKVFRELGYISGKFQFQLNLHRNVLGNRKSTAFISAISDDRTQISISYAGKSYIETTPLIDYDGNRLEFYVNLGFNFLLRIAAITKDDENSTDKENVYLVTLQEPLDSDIELNAECWIDLQVADPITDTISILPKKKKDPLVGLRVPNFSIELETGLAQSTGFKTWDTILGSNPTSSQQLINNIISSSFDPIELNVDYRDYSNFVFYGSAVDKLNNFRYKLQLLDYYSSTLNTLNSIVSPGSEVTTNKIEIETKKNALLAGFDGYEKYLYYESSSYETSSYGEFWPTTWPKQNSVKPYVNFAVTSSQGTAWYFGQLSSASLYDKQNLNRLGNSIPEFISSDIANDTYVTFVNMIGQHFDILRSYVEQIPNIHSRKEPLYEGLAKDLVYQVLASLGMDVINGFNVQDLWLSSLGVNQSGGYTQSGSLFSMPTDDIVKETWKRILNNLPYLLKTKGTERGIRALLNCYGVPATIYRVREYSGPYQYDSDSITQRDRYKRVEKFTYGMGLSGSFSTVAASAPGGSNMLQFRFKPFYLPTTYTIASAPISIQIAPSASSTTDAILTVAGVALSGSFYNSWVNISVESGKTYVLQNRDGEINRFDEINSGTVAGVTLGGSNVNFLAQEIRYWDEALPETVIREHCLNPQSILAKNTVDTYDSATWQYDGVYDYTAPFVQLLARYPLGSTLQIYGTGSIHPNKNISRAAATVSGVTTASFKGNVETYYVWGPNLGDGMDHANKIRIESTNLDGQLSSNASVEKSQYDTYQLDSPKVGVFFSPQDEINEDIADQFGGLLLDDYIGDPRDDYNDKYTALEGIRTHYNRKFTGNNTIWKYTRLVENFDASMFYLVKKFLPARSAKMVGLVIQPTILERSKTFIHPMGVERMDYLAEIPMTDYEFLGEYPTYEGDIPEISELISGDFIQMESNDTIAPITVVGDVPMYEGDIPSNALSNTLHSNVESIMDPAYDGFYRTVNGDLVRLRDLRYQPLSFLRSRYLGSQISSPGFNIPSEDTFDGAPVIEYWNTNPGVVGTSGNPLNPINTLLGPGTIGIGSAATE